MNTIIIGNKPDSLNTKKNVLHIHCISFNNPFKGFSTGLTGSK